MIFAILHLMACVAMVAAAVFWRFHVPEAASIHLEMRPFVILAGVFGLIIVLDYFTELFLAYYSGAIFEVEEHIWWRTGFSIILTMLPFAGLVPQVRGRPISVMVLGGFAAVPSLLLLLSS